jgi:hypothetical protein
MGRPDLILKGLWRPIVFDIFQPQPWKVSHMHNFALLALILIPLALFLFLFFGKRQPWPLTIYLSLGAMMIVPHHAFAAVAAATSPTVLQNVPAAEIDALGQFAAAFILALGAALWKWLDNRSPLKNTQAEELARQAFSTLLDKGAQFGASQVDSGLTKVGNTDVHNAAVAAGANFVIAHGPDMAKALGFDIETPAGQAAIIRSVTLRVSQLLSPQQQTTMAAGDLSKTVTETPTAKPITLPAQITLASTPTSPQPGAALDLANNRIPPAKND